MPHTLERQKLIRPDEWLARFFNHPVYQILADRATSEKEKNEFQEFFFELGDKPAFSYAKAATADRSAIRFLETLGFRLIDTQMTFEKPRAMGARPTGQYQVRFAIPEDQKQVSELARKNCQTSRFHRDELIPRETADQIKASWAENYFSGKRGDQMVVALEGDRVIGFLQLVHVAGATLVIDLIATDQSYRRKGIASGMIAFAEHELPQASKIRVGTQVSNSPSLALYEKLGFRIATTHYLFHHHSPAASL